MTAKPIELYCQTYGQGAPLIILHGLLGSSSNWTMTSQLLGRQQRVFAVDLRNHGKSPHSMEFNFPVMCEDLKHFIETRNLRQPAILGHSIGGKVAMAFADLYPEMIDRIIIVDVAPKPYPETGKVIVDALDAMLALNLDLCQGVNDVVDVLATAIPSLELRAFLAKNLRKLPTGNLGWTLNLRGIRDNIDILSEGPILKNRYRGPVLFVRGELSDYIQDEDEAKIRETYPCAEISTVAGAGHWVHIDNRNNFLEAVLSFFSS